MRRGHHVGVVEPGGKRSPLREPELAFNTEDVGGSERDGEAYSGIEKDVVVGEVAGVALEDVGGDVRYVKELLGGAEFVIVGTRRPKGELRGGAVEGAHFGGGAEEQVLDGGSAEGAIVGSTEHDAEFGDVPGEAETRAPGGVADADVVMVKADSAA